MVEYLYGLHYVKTTACLVDYLIFLLLSFVSRTR